MKKAFRVITLAKAYDDDSYAVVLEIGPSLYREIKEHQAFVREHEGTYCTEIWHPPIDVTKDFEEENDGSIVLNVGWKANVKEECALLRVMDHEILVTFNVKYCEGPGWETDDIPIEDLDKYFAGDSK